jgi:alpha-1,3-mannosyltransferase
MKVLHVVRQFYPMIGGLENYVLNLAKQQVESGYQVSVVTLNRDFVDKKSLQASGSIDHIQIYRIPFFGSARYPLAFSVLKYLKGYDVIHVHAVDFFADYLALTKPVHGKKMILTTHGGFFHTTKNKRFKQIFFNTVTRWTLKRFKAIIVCSSNDYQIFYKICHNLVLIYGGVDMNKYNVIPKKREKGLLVTVGRIDSHKCIDKLIIMVQKLVVEHIDVRLLIVGSDHRRLWSKLQQLVNEHQVADRVTMRGKVTESELIESYAKADIFLSASSYEGFGITAVEALASGTPCVLNNIPSFKEIIGSNEFGRVVDFDDDKEVIQSIRNFFNLEEHVYARLSDMARIRANYFNWKKIALKINKLYEC